MLFSISEVKEAIGRCKFKKGLDLDSFKGEVPKEEKLKEQVSFYILRLLNKGIFSE